MEEDQDRNLRRKTVAIKTAVKKTVRGREEEDIFGSCAWPVTASHIAADNSIFPKNNYARPEV